MHQAITCALVATPELVCITTIMRPFSHVPKLHRHERAWAANEKALLAEASLMVCENTHAIICLLTVHNNEDGA